MTITEGITSTNLEAVSARIPTHILRAAIASVDPCRGKDKTRPILAAIRLEISVGELVAVATDSYTCAEYRHPVDAPNFSPVIISSAGVETILTATKGKVSLDLEITLSGDILTLDTENARHFIGLETGTYPDYTALIPQPGFGEALQIEGCGYDADYLAKVAKIGKAINPDRTAARVELVTLTNSKTPSRWDLTGLNGSVIFLIMPFRKA